MKNSLLLLVFFLHFALSYSQTNTPCASGSVVAPSLPVNASCTYTTGTTVGATAQTNNANGNTPSCGTMGEDVWYSFTAPATGAVVVSTQSAGITDGVMSIYSGTCGAWVELACSDDAIGLMPEISLAGLTPGTTYLVRFWEYGGGTGTFNICVTSYTPPTAPTNDNCANAISLTMNVNGECNTTSGTVTGATSSGTTTCSGTSDDDVWYSFVATNDSAYIARLTNFDSQIQVLTSCGGTSLLCADAEDSQLLTGLTIGSTYIIRLFSWSSTPPSDGTFELCVFGPAPPPENVLCAAMEPICSDSPITFPASAGGQDAEDIEPGNNYDCLLSSPNPTWYYLELEVGGNLSIDITASDDVDYAIWGPYSSLSAAQSACGTYPLPIDCSYDPSEIEQANVPGTLVGEIYVLLVTNYADVPQIISVTSSPTNTATTNCAIVPLSVMLIDFKGKKTIRGTLLEWSTQSEINNSNFTIDHSFNGIQWQTIHQTPSKGNSGDSYNFEYIHETAEKNYFRLIQTDFNGTSELIKTIVLSNIDVEYKLLKTINSIGSIVDDNYSGMVIDIYSDGTSIKRFQ